MKILNSGFSGACTIQRVLKLINASQIRGIGSYWFILDRLSENSRRNIPNHYLMEKGEPEHDCMSNQNVAGTLSVYQTQVALN